MPYAGTVPRTRRFRPSNTGLIFILTCVFHPLNPEYLRSFQIFSGFRVAQSLVLCVVLLRSLIALLLIFFWPLCCLFIFDSQLLITSHGIFQLFLNNVHFCTVVGPDKLISKIDLLHLKKLNNTEMMTT